MAVKGGDKAASLHKSRIVRLHACRSQIASSSPRSERHEHRRRSRHGADARKSAFPGSLGSSAFSGAFQPEPDADDNRARIIDTTATQHPPTSSLQVLDCATGEVVWASKRQFGCTLTMDTPDLRSKVQNVVIFEAWGAAC